MSWIIKNKFLKALTFALIGYLLLEGVFYLMNIQVGMGGIYTQKRQLLSKAALFALLFGLIYALLKEKVGIFNLLFLLFAFVLTEAVIIEKGNSFGIRRHKIGNTTPSTTSPTPPKQATKFDPKKKLIANLESTLPDPILGYTLKPGTFLVKKHCYEVIYTNTANSIRENPVKNNTKNKAVLFGCSFTYGTGLDDEFTLAANLAKLDTTRNYLNIGQEGWGMQHLLANLTIKAAESPFLKNSIADADLGIYFYLQDHIYRLLGKNHLVGYHWGTAFPYYKVDIANQKVKLDGKLGEQLTISQRIFYFPVHVSLIYKKIYYRYIYKGAKPLVNQDYQKAALVIKESKDAFLKTGENKRFVVVIFPFTSNKIKEYLIQYNIETLDYAELVDKSQLSEYIVCKEDTHPNPLLNALVSEKIYQEILAN